MAGNCSESELEMAASHLNVPVVSHRESSSKPVQVCLNTSRTTSGPLWVPGLGPVLSLCWSSRSCWGPRVGFSPEGSKLDEGLSAESSNRESSWAGSKTSVSRPHIEQALSVMSVSHQVVAVNVQFLLGCEALFYLCVCCCCQMLQGLGTFQAFKSDLKNFMESADCHLV